MDRDDRLPEAGQSSHLQFSLATLLVLVTVAALVAASVSELPDWIGAPLLALVATAAAAVVVGAAIRSKGYALTFYIGAAFPLCMLVVRTSLIFAAFSDGIAQQEAATYLGPRVMQFYGENYLDQRLSYRWEATVVLACAPLVGLVCVAFRWLGDKERQTGATKRSERRRWLVPLLACLLLLAVGGTLSVAIRAIKGVLPPDPAWDSHDGSPVSPSGRLVSTLSTLTVGDRVLVEQGGTWWKARVKRIRGGNSVEIHYAGWDSNWDETVPITRIQLP